MVTVVTTPLAGLGTLRRGPANSCGHQEATNNDAVGGVLQLLMWSER